MKKNSSENFFTPRINFFNVPFFIPVQKIVVDDFSSLYNFFLLKMIEKTSEKIIK